MKNNTLKYFYEIMKIPRESGNEVNMVEYLKDFANKRKLDFFCDNFNNIIIFKNKNINSKIILQAHIDMVCESKDKNFDFKNEPITPKINGDFLSADNTSLGADNGIGVAIILSLLEEDLPVGIEAVFTSEEETTMNGAKNLDIQKLSAKKLLSFDGDSDEVIEVSSAGIISGNIKFEFPKLCVFGHCYKLQVSNLLGGHSGTDIDKNRTNAILLAFNILKSNNLELVEIKGGSKENVIPTFFELTFVSKNKIDDLISLVDKQPNISVEYQYLGEKQIEVFDNKIVDFVLSIPNGVLQKYDDGFVMTSQNIAKIDSNKNYVLFSLRSSNKKSERYWLQKLRQVISQYNCKLTITNSCPFFETSIQSSLVAGLQNSYQSLFGDLPKINRVHAGLEGGVFAQKLSGVEIAVLGANINDMHSYFERVSLTSIDKLYLWAYEYLKNYC